jgi:hypothetical protein
MIETFPESLILPPGNAPNDAFATLLHQTERDLLSELLPDWRRLSYPMRRQQAKQLRAIQAGWLDSIDIVNRKALVLPPPAVWWSKHPDSLRLTDLVVLCISMFKQISQFPKEVTQFVSPI